MISISVMPSPCGHSSAPARRDAESLRTAGKREPVSAAATWDELAAGLARARSCPQPPSPRPRCCRCGAPSCSCAATRSPPGASRPTSSTSSRARSWAGPASWSATPTASGACWSTTTPITAAPRPTIRILRPILGDGLFLAEGAAWKHQRRTMAPAFAPRSLDVAAAHIAQVAEETVAELTARGTGAVDLLRVVQRLALEVAGRSFFSQGMARARRGPARRLRALRRQAGAAVLPRLPAAGRAAPSPLDAARWWLARDFKRVLDRMIAERARTPPQDPPRDLFDVLVAARDPETGAGLHPDAAARPDRDPGRGRPRDHGTDHVLAGLPAVPGAGGAGAGGGGGAGGRPLARRTRPQAMERLPLTRAVVQEALRLYPPAFTIVRMALGADELVGPGRARRAASSSWRPGSCTAIASAGRTPSASTRPASCPAPRRSTASPTCRSASARGSASAPSSP